MEYDDVVGTIFDVKRFSTDDGPGIRTTVFLKGCPLRCLWCHNPESIRAEPELVFLEQRCLHCGACVIACKKGAQHIDQDLRRIDRTICDSCGDCALVCPGGALELRGQRVSASEIVNLLTRDEVFYRQSGGGITLSGGEPTAQPAFVKAILQGCSERGIHTALDTNGFAPWEVLRSLLPFVNIFLFDIKHLDPAEHWRLTGAPNGPILRNLKLLIAAGAHVQLRVPLIPGLTDSLSNVGAIAAFAQQNGIDSIALLPYNRATGSKYRWLGKDYELEHLEAQTEEYLSALADLVRSHGIEVQVGG